MFVYRDPKKPPRPFFALDTTAASVLAGLDRPRRFRVLLALLVLEPHNARGDYFRATFKSVRDVLGVPMSNASFYKTVHELAADGYIERSDRGPGNRTEWWYRLLSIYGPANDADAPREEPPADVLDVDAMLRESA